MLLAVLPPFSNKKTLITQTQSTSEIVDSIVETHRLYESDYDLIYKFFDTGDVYTTCKLLWEFCKYNLNYEVESENFQSVRSPGAILSNPNVDCKHYSLFIGGVLDAIKRTYADGWDWCYRFASYGNSKHVEHVFVVAFDNNEIWVDPVLSSFNDHKKPKGYIDKYIMALYKVSGVDSGVEVDVDSNEALKGFFTMVNLNLFGIRDLLRSQPDILNGAVKQFFLTNGYDFDVLTGIINNGVTL